MTVKSLFELSVGPMIVSISGHRHAHTFA